MCSEEPLALNVYIAHCYYKLHYYEMSQVILVVTVTSFLSTHADGQGVWIYRLMFVCCVCVYGYEFLRR